MKNTVYCEKNRTSVGLFALLAMLSLLLLGGRQLPVKRDAVHQASAQIAAESAAFETEASRRLVEKHPVVLLRANVVKQR